MEKTDQSLKKLDSPQTASEAPETKLVVSWPDGQPLAWRLERVIVRPPEPRWARRARELKALGWSIRRIMKELGVKSSRHLREILDKKTV